MGQYSTRKNIFVIEVLRWGDPYEKERASEREIERERGRERGREEERERVGGKKKGIG